MKTVFLTTLLLLLIVIAIGLPRGLTLDRFVTPDESKWLTRSANFFVALAQGDFANTYQQGHPGVTIMWAGTTGFLWRFPGYITERPGQHKSPQKFKHFLEKRDYDDVPMLLLESSRVFIVLGNVIILTLAVLATVRLIGLIPALIGFLLIAFDPFSIGLSRLLHPDALLSALMLLSLLFFMNFLYKERHLYTLTLSALAAGLAWLTKSPAFFLIPFFGLLSLVEIGHSWRLEGQSSLRAVWIAIWPFLAWVGIAALVFVLLWPAMWIDPIGSLQKVFGGAVTYAAEGHHAATFFDGQIYQAGSSDWRFYPVNYLWRTTPSILIGLVLAGFAIIFRRRLSFPKEQQHAVFILILFAVLYTIFMTFGEKKFDRYLLPIFAPLALVAAVGWVVMVRSALSWINTHWNLGSKASNISKLGAAAFLTLIILIQLVESMQTFPYYLTYYNPLMGGSSKAHEVMMIGWGEGLDQAARYLNAKPDAAMLRVQSWYPDGPFSYIFDGKTLYDEGFTYNPEELKKADYYVLYYHQLQRMLPSEEFIQYFDQQVPEYIVYIDGLEYARIYLRAAMQSPSKSD